MLCRLSGVCFERDASGVSILSTSTNRQRAVFTVYFVKQNIKIYQVTVAGHLVLSKLGY